MWNLGTNNFFLFPNPREMQTLHVTMDILLVGPIITSTQGSYVAQMFENT
jgi:hypothetical protein